MKKYLDFSCLRKAEKIQIIAKEQKITKAQAKRRLESRENRHQAFCIYQSAATRRISPLDKNLIALGNDLSNTAQILAVKQHPRLQNWMRSEAGLKQGIRVKSFEYKGRHKGRTGYRYYPQIQSVCSLAPGSIFCAINGNKFKLYAGKGWEFFRDSNGIGIRSINLKDKDYHFCADELLEKDAIRKIKQKAQENWAKRQFERIKRERLDQLKNPEVLKATGALVSVLDSERAGNCRVGTMQFIERNHLPKLLPLWRAVELEINEPRFKAVIDYRIQELIAETSRRQICL